MTDIRPCTQCERPTTPDECNDAWVCVDCQEYNYYHQVEVTVKKQLFRGVIQQRDGEREYSYNEYVLADNLDDAQSYFEHYLSTWFGDETRVQEDGEVWDSSWEVAAKLDYVSEHTSFTVESDDGFTVANVDLLVTAL